MKFLTTTLILAFGISAMAMDWTGRVELRDTITAGGICQAGASNCSAAGGIAGLGVGLTTEDAYSFNQNWGIHSGGMLRQRIVGANVGSLNETANYLDFDIPVALDWHNETFNIRAGVDVVLKLQSYYGGFQGSNYTDSNGVMPYEGAIDWKFAFNQLVSLSYETASTLAYNTTANTANTALQTSSVVSIGYGWKF